MSTENVSNKNRTLHKAILAVMSQVERLEKTDHNPHGHYRYATVDAFFDFMRPKLIDAGLLITMEEVSCEVEGGWVRARFAITIMHIESGESMTTIRTSSANASMGSQAYGSAQSFALKPYLRSLFLVSTGEPEADVDKQPKGDLPKTKPRFTGPPAALAASDNSKRAVQGVIESNALSREAVAEIHKEHGSPQPGSMQYDLFASVVLAKAKEAGMPA